jgi:hypothetical protein
VALVIVIGKLEVGRAKATHFKQLRERLRLLVGLEEGVFEGDALGLLEIVSSFPLPPFIAFPL